MFNEFYRIFFLKRTKIREPFLAENLNFLSNFWIYFRENQCGILIQATYLKIFCHQLVFDCLQVKLKLLNNSFYTKFYRLPIINKNKEVTKIRVISLLLLIILSKMSHFM